MKMKNVARAAAVLAGVVGLVATSTSPASAEGLKTIAFTGDATVTGGLGYPCTNNTTSTPNLADNTTSKSGQKTCPPDVSVHPNNATNKKGKVVGVNGDTRTGTFGSTACVGAGATVGKAGKSAVGAGLCAITAAFTVTGYCGLSQGTGTARVTLANEVGNDQTYTANFVWISTGTVLTLRGTADPGDWYLTGTVSAAPNPLQPGSCTNKTGSSFLITGVVTIVHPNPTTLP